MRSPVHVSMAANGRYERPLTVALASLAAGHQPGGCEVTVLHHDFPASARRRVEREVAGGLAALEWLPVDEQVLAGAHAPARLTTACLYRLLLPALLTRRGRTIYLDADLVVLEPLRPLWEIDLGGSVLGAVRDALSPWAAGPDGTDWRALGLAPDTPYLNSGMLIIDLDAWRHEQLAAAAVDVLRRVRAPWGDQCAINAVAAGRWLELPRRWNLQTADADGRGAAWALWPEDVRAALADPAVIHWNGPTKPWSAGPPPPFAGRWFELLDQTSMAGWRPAATSRRRPARVGTKGAG